VILIGERINGTFKDIGRAVANRNPEPVKDWALRQVENGADYLDLNVGPNSEEPAADMRWLVESVRAVTDCAVCLDSTNFDAIRAGLEIAGQGSMINSCSADRERVQVAFPMAVEYGASLVCLTMNEEGVPRDHEARLMLAMELLMAAEEFGLPPDRVFIDPLVLPVSVAQEHVVEALRTIQSVKLLSSPQPKSVIGLSNVSQRTFDRSLINRTMLVMAMAMGLDAAILDVCDESLIEAWATARILLNQEIYADSYLKLAKTRK